MRVCSLKNKVLVSVVLSAQDLAVVMPRRLEIVSEQPWMEVTLPFLSFPLWGSLAPFGLESGLLKTCKQGVFIDSLVVGLEHDLVGF